MKFIREVTIERLAEFLTPEMVTMQTQGDFTLVWKENSVEIWAKVNTDNMANMMHVAQ